MRVTNRFMITVVRKKDPIASVLGCGGIRRIGLVPAGATEVQSANDSRYHFGAPRFSRRYRRGSATLVDSARKITAAPGPRPDQRAARRA